MDIDMNLNALGRAIEHDVATLHLDSAVQDAKAALRVSQHLKPGAITRRLDTLVRAVEHAEHVRRDPLTEADYVAADAAEQADLDQDALDRSTLTSGARPVEAFEQAERQSRIARARIALAQSGADTRGLDDPFASWNDSIVLTAALRDMLELVQS